MTKQFHRTANCPNCGYDIPLEDAMGQWIRNHPELSSRDGFAFMDRDLVVHRFKTTHGRSLQCLMFVEVKTRGAELNESQRDSMLTIHQLLRNRRTTPTKKARWQSQGTPTKVYSSLINTEVRVISFGYYLLTLSHSAPSNSAWMTWQKREIDQSTLIKLLRFDLDPETLRPLDFRLHHVKHPELHFA